MRLRAMGVSLCAAVAVLWGVAPASAQGAEWLISVMEGEAVVVDGLRRVAAVSGLRLEAGAIIETSAKTSIIRLEGSDQSTYDLGPDTRAMLAPAGFAPRNERVPQLYLLHGWVKATARGSREAAGVVSPAMEVLPFRGAVVLQQGKREQAAFVESGRIDLVERKVGAGGGITAVNAGEFYGAEGNRRGNVTARPAPGWAQSVPRPFRDPIPLRAQAFKDKRVEPPVLPGPTYTHLADWLASEYTLRQMMPARFGPLARDATFRNEVAAHIAVHPEWGPVVTNENRPTQGNRRK